MAWRSYSLGASARRTTVVGLLAVVVAGVAFCQGSSDRPRISDKIEEVSDLDAVLWTLGELCSIDPGADDVDARSVERGAPAWLEGARAVLVKVENVEPPDEGGGLASYFAIDPDSVVGQRLYVVARWSADPVSRLRVASVVAAATGEVVAERVLVSSSSLEHLTEC